MTQRKLPAPVQTVVDDMLPKIKALTEGPYAVSLGGSFGRGNFDQNSDLDFRLYRETIPPESDEHTQNQAQVALAIQQWGERGKIIDGVWTRPVKDISEALDRWCDGVVAPVELVWTIWGYHLLPDIYNQYVIDDPFGIMAGWKDRLRTYPPKLKTAVLKKHVQSIRYWRNDYHYRNKVQRKDVVFLAGLTSKLVHDLIQILFAVNETYFTGDGNNLAYLQKFSHIPSDFVANVEDVLYPQPGDEVFEAQYHLLMRLIDEVEALLDALGALP